MVSQLVDDNHGRALAEVAGSQHDEEARRYEQAAEDALEQLAWCIGYLHGIGKTNVSRALSRNLSLIRSALMR